MNLIRSVISLFLLVVLGLSIAGWFWAGSQPSVYVSVGARVVLVPCAAMSLASIILLWRVKRPASS